MSVFLKYDKNTNILHAVIEGEISHEDIENTMHSILTSEAYSPDVDTLWDLSRLEFSTKDASVEAMLIATRIEYTGRGKAKIAIFASSDLAYGMSRRYEVLSEGLSQNIGVFRDFSEAEKWLSHTRNVRDNDKL